MEGIARSEPDLGDSFERFWERLRETNWLDDVNVQLKRYTAPVGPDVVYELRAGE